MLEESVEPMTLDPRTRAGRAVQSFVLGFGRMPGYIVGRHLLELGHRDVAFLCLSERDVAFRERFAGMRAAFDEPGIADRLHPVTSPRWRRGVHALHRPVQRSRALQILQRAAAAAERGPVYGAYVACMSKS